MKKKRRRKKSKKTRNIIIGTTLIIVCLIVLNFIYYQSPSTDDSNQTISYKAAIVDHLSFKEKTKNETFVKAAMQILRNDGYKVDYYKGEEVTVDFYRKLPEHHYGLIIFRVHSGLTFYDKDTIGPPLGLYTSENYSETKYLWEQALGLLLAGGFSGEETLYFTISPSFIKMNGRYDDAVIIMMGCDGLTYNYMASAFIKRGAKFYVSWNAAVRSSHTDQAIVCLLQHLITEKQTIREAVENTMNEVGPDPIEKSELLYYPDEAQNYSIVQSSLIINVADTKKGKRYNPG